MSRSPTRAAISTRAKDVIVWPVQELNPEECAAVDSHHVPAR
jgi:hypothetical protein